MVLPLASSLPSSTPSSLSYHRPPPPGTSSPPCRTALASATVSARSFNCDEMNDAFWGSPVQAEMSMISRAWLSKVSRVCSCGRGKGDANEKVVAPVEGLFGGSEARRIETSCTQRIKECVL